MPERTLQELAFPYLTGDQIAIIAKTARLKCSKDGDVLFNIGDTEMKFYVVKSGEVEILDHSGGQPRTVTIHRPGQFTGDISHLLDLAASSTWISHRQPFLLETSRPGVFTAGDARLGSVKRVASAVGEGAMAVQFIHEYLKEV